MKELALREKTGGEFQIDQIKIFKDLVGNTHYDKCLEVGCGKGFFTYIIAKNKQINQSYGCDIFEDFQKEDIKPFVKKIEYTTMKDETLPYLDNQFDLVFSMDVIEHVTNDVKFFKEHIRVCKPGGKIIIGTPNYNRPTNLISYIFGQLKFPKNMGNDTYGGCIHLREYTKQQLLELVNKNSKLIDTSSIVVTPNWFGIMALNLGITKLPHFLQNYCQFWFVSFLKK